MKNLIYIIAILSTIIVSSQNLNYQNELVRTVKIPNTPEAEAFAKYGNTSVSMYSGTPNISVPIYTISGSELDLPINLTYDASGVKVGQLASQVGLGWNLNVGGRISRRTNGLVDDYIWVANNPYKSVYSDDIVFLDTSTGKTLKQLIADYKTPPGSFISLEEGKNYFKFLKAISDNELDTQPDYFSFNALGVSDHFVFDMESSSSIIENSFVALDNPRIKIYASFNNSPNYITNWTVTTEDGTKLYFNQAEKTHTEGDDTGGNSLIIQDYNSSWLLTKIESPNKKDIYEFTYTNFSLTENQPSMIISAVTNELSDPTPQTAATFTYQTTTYKVSQLALTQIKHNGNIVIDIALKSRDDYNVASAIDSINIYKLNGSNLLKSYKFNHSYFGDPSTQNNYDVRLKLDEVVIKSPNNTLSSYSFDYFSPQSVPSRVSYAQDYLGLYNGKNSNSVLYPAVTAGGTNFTGADRSSDYSYAIIGNLKKITYPTGGYSEFTYEPDKTTYTTSDITSTTQDVTYGSLSVAAGIGNGVGCGACCIDKFGNPPNINSTLLNITEAGNYDISYANSNGSSGEAYLFKRSFKLNITTAVAYDQLIDQSSCGITEDLTWSHFSGSNGDVVYLETGTYQMTLVKGVSATSGSISLSVYREETTSNSVVGTGAVPRAGIRIKNIKDYSDTNVLSSEKEYRYTTSLNGFDSSGQLLFNPTFYTTSTYQVFISSPNPGKNQVYGINTFTRMTRASSWSGGDRPHVAYSKVYEIQKDQTDNNGYIEHNFSVGPNSGVYSTGVSPSANLYFNNYSTGKEYLTKVHKSDNELLNLNTTSYINTQYFGNSTIYVKNNPVNSYNYVRIYPNGSGEYIYTYELANFVGFNGPFGPGSLVTPQQPSTCGLPNNYCMSSLDYSTLETLLTYAQGRIGGVLANYKENYLNGKTLKQSTTNSYDAAIDYLLRESKTVNSLGDTLSTKQYYPRDFSGSSVYNSMININRLDDVVRTETYSNSQKTGTTETSFKQWGSKILPEFIRSAKDTLQLEDRIQYHSYYTNGNVQEVSLKNGSRTVYIWGYGDKYPIAKIENTSYSTIEALTEFGTDFSIANGLSINQEIALRALPNALVTTYTYDPLVGVTSITDPNGQTVTYHYDEFNRLEFVKDKDGMILSQNQYNYKN